jgi:heat-inducible transcriptional repressor
MLTVRQHQILSSLVAEYIEQGAPVSSSWLAEHVPFGLSPATVRNILVRLEEQGLVRQPHTSAGRVPTDSGYRLYVDLLLGSRRRSKPSREMELRLRRSGTVGDLLEHASHEVSRASHQIGFALAPASATARLRHIDFVNLDGARILVVVVAAGGQITHHVIETEERYDAVTLTQAANYVNAEFAGMTLDEARTAIVERMREERLLYDALLARMLTLARNGLDAVEPEETLHIQGASLLMDEMDDLGGDAADRQQAFETLRAFFRMIEEKHQFVELLTRSMEASGLVVVIGSEHSSPGLRAFSLVAATFQDGNRSGAVGIIGPTRMHYHRAISVVDGVSQAVSRLLEGQ